VQGGLIRAQIDAPWLYPPAPSPWWDRVGDPALRGDLQTRFSIAVGGTTTTAHTVHFFDPTRFRPWITRDAGGARVESLEFISPLR
jgi:hypothetical protein